MTTEAPRLTRIVVADANVLINLLHVGRLDLLAALPGFEFVVPEHVVAEITEPAQRDTLHGALDRQILREQQIADIPTLALFAELIDVMGRGEAACIALANSHGWLVASDEKGAVRREAAARLGEGKIITTAGLLVMAIRAGSIGIEEADQAKAVLEQHRFKLKFRSFADLVTKEK